MKVKPLLLLAIGAGALGGAWYFLTPAKQTPPRQPVPASPGQGGGGGGWFGQATSTISDLAKLAGSLWGGSREHVNGSPGNQGGNNGTGVEPVPSNVDPNADAATQDKQFFGG